MKNIFILPLFIIVLFVMTACSSATLENNTENASLVLAETACVMLDSNTSNEEKVELANALPVKYGFEDPQSMDAYIDSLKGTDEAIILVENTAKNIGLFCEDIFIENGLSPYDVASESLQSIL